MDVADALRQIGEIHSHLAKAEEYRGYRPAALAVSGVLGLLASVAQGWLVPVDDPSVFVRYWVAVALVCGCLAGGASVVGYVFHEDEHARQRTRTVMRQFIPCLLVGIVVTGALARSDRLDRAIVFLPGLWSLLYGLGIVASLPYLPRLAGVAAIWYLAAGGLLLFLVEGAAPSGWTVGVPFGVGQLFASAILYRTRRVEVET